MEKFGLISQKCRKHFFLLNKEIWKKKFKCLIVFTEKSEIKNFIRNNSIFSFINLHFNVQKLK